MLVIVSSLFLVTSIIMLILSTVPEFQVCLVIMAAGDNRGLEIMVSC